MKFFSTRAVALVLAASATVQAINLKVDDPASVKAAAKTLAYGMVKYYHGNATGDVPGNLPDPYYWWETGAMFSSLIDYYYFTKDDTYNEITMQAMLHQTGPNNNYMPNNQSKSLGNDDQAFWGMAALNAAETNFPNPPDDKPQWLALAQAVYNTQVPRWDTTSCGGGLKWQIFQLNNGFNYKNTISNGCFFNMAARLAKYTGNTTYVEQAERSWNWITAIGLMSPDYHFYDGTDDTKNCSDTNKIQWTYNAGVMLLGAASLWNVTGSDVWKERTLGIIKGLDVFFHPQVANVMYEVACESNGKCNVDQRSFKAYLSRWIAQTIKVAPFTRDLLWPKITTSAAAAAAQCNTGYDQAQCGLKWTQGGVNDGSLGVGEQMSALEIVQSLLIDTVSGPFTNETGGTSKGDYSAGLGGDDGIVFNTITTGDRVGAGFLTTFVLAGVMGGAYWMVS